MNSPQDETVSDDAIMRCLRSLVVPHESGAEDAALIERYLTLQDSTAFELLVWRHVGMVLKTCRMVLRDLHAAEDAAQAVFLVFARKVSTIRDRKTCAGWLHRTAYRISLRAASLRRHQKTSTALAMELDELPDRTTLDGDGIAPANQDSDTAALIQEELNRLPQKFRIPILLCYFEGLTYVDAAKKLGWPIGTLNGRIAAAKEILRKRLSHRGVALSAGLAVLANDTSAAMLSGLVQKMTRASIAFAAGRTPGTSLLSQQLAHDALKAMFFAKLQWATGCMAMCGILIFCGLAAVGSYGSSKGELPASPPAADFLDGVRKNEPPVSVAAVAGREIDRTKRIDQRTIDEFVRMGARSGLFVEIEEVGYVDDSAIRLSSTRRQPQGLSALTLQDLVDEQGRLPSMPRVDVPVGIDLRGSRISNDGLRDLACFPLMTRLYLAGTRIDDDGLRELARFPYLEILQVSDTLITDEGMKCIAMLPRLRILDMNRTAITDAGLDDLVAIKSLKTLNMISDDISDEGTKTIKLMENLVHVKLSETRVTKKGLRELASMPCLAHLDLEGLHLNDRAIKELKSLKQLKILLLGGNSLTDEGARELASFENLASLNLDGAEITDEGVKDIARIKNLTDLSLSNTNITDLGASYLAECPHLQSLRVTQTRLSDASVKSLSKHKQLKRLFLSGTSVTDSCVKDVAKIPNLIRVSFRGSGVTTRGYLELKNLRPELEVSEFGQLSLQGLKSLLEAQ